jgi:hypothetical protein
MVADGNNGFTPEMLEKYRQFYERFPGTKKIKSETGADVICPAHDDHNPSLGIDLVKNGAGPKIVMNCRSAGCDYRDILDAVGLTPRDLWFSENGDSEAPENEIAGCTVEQYAEYKGLPAEFLTGDTVGLRDTVWWNVPTVEIPYVDEEGEYVLSRYRISLTGKKDGKKTRKVVSKKGDPAMLYGLHYLEDAREAGYALLGEGESDCHSAWYRGIPAIGIPGARNWKPEWAEHLHGIDHILMVVEPDGAGKELWVAVSSTKAIRNRLERIEP